MAKFIRYALATFCFACCVGCLALSEKSQVVKDANGGISLMSVGTGSRRAQVWRGDLYVSLGTPEGASFISYPVAMERWGRTISMRDRFILSQDVIVCPLWYPASVFALAGVGAIRFRRQFSIRSALIAFAIVAALLAMPLTL